MQENSTANIAIVSLLLLNTYKQRNIFSIRMKIFILWLNWIANFQKPVVGFRCLNLVLFAPLLINTNCPKSSPSLLCMWPMISSTSSFCIISSKFCSSSDRESSSITPSSLNILSNSLPYLKNCDWSMLQLMGLDHFYL